MIIKSQQISVKVFEPYGELVTLEDAQTFDCNQGRAVRYDDLIKAIDTTDDGGRTGVSVYKSKASKLPFNIDVMERHPLGSQAFLPIATNPQSMFLIAVAPVGELIKSAIHAFLVPANIGINYRKGVWHLPIVALDEPMDFVAIDRIGPGKNCDEVYFESDSYCIK